MENGLIKRNLLPVAQEVIEHAPVVVISGARQVGKSTLMQMLLEHQQHRLVNLDSMVARESAISDPEGFVDQFPEGVLAIDEAQRAPDLLLSIKLSVDRKRRRGGSSSRARRICSPPAEARRAWLDERRRFGCMA